jgi:hypothetical protein
MIGEVTRRCMVAFSPSASRPFAINLPTSEK